VKEKNNIFHCVIVSICVCVGEERKKEREREGEKNDKYDPLLKFDVLQ